MRIRSRSRNGRRRAGRPCFPGLSMAGVAMISRDPARSVRALMRAAAAAVLGCTDVFVDSVAGHRPLHRRRIARSWLGPGRGPLTAAAVGDRCTSARRDPCGAVGPSRAGRAWGGRMRRRPGWIVGPALAHQRVELRPHQLFISADHFDEHVRCPRGADHLKSITSHREGPSQSDVTHWYSASS